MPRKKSETNPHEARHGEADQVAHKPRRASRARKSDRVSEADATPAETSSPGGYGLVGRLIYGTAYVVSYGITFPVLLLSHAVPSDNALVHGLVDGASAARETVAGMLEAPTGPALETEGHSPAALPA